MSWNCTWFNEPAAWTNDGERLSVTAAEETDFWRETHYGFIHNNGHFFAARSRSDFTCEVHVRGVFENLYDQAGLMVKIDDETWLKATGEFSDGKLVLGTVLTFGKSDWCIGVPIDRSTGFWIRISVADEVVKVQYSLDGARWPLLRLAPFPHADGYLVGPLVCAPMKGGLVVEFKNFSLGAATRKNLHDLT